jgi:hypothetical protein
MVRGPRVETRGCDGPKSAFADSHAGVAADFTASPSSGERDGKRSNHADHFEQSAKADFVSLLQRIHSPWPEIGRRM